VSVAFALLAYAAVLAVVAPRVLARSWVDRAPRVAIAAWQAVTGSVVVSVVLGAVALTFPTVGVSANLAALLQECFLALRDHYASPGGAAAGGTGAVLAIGITARVTWCAAVTLIRVAAKRRRLRNQLAILGRGGPGPRIVVVDHETPAAYCVPGTGRRIVVTSAALEALDDTQLQAVLAHERAHLRGRHDLVIAGAATLAAAFGRVRLFRTAHAEISRLVELLADDVAVKGSDRLTVAEALLTLGGGGGGGPVGALAAGGSAAGARVRRLIAGHRPLGRARVTAGSFSAIALLAVPALVLATPAALAWGSQYCPPDHPAMVSAASSAMPSAPDCPMPDCASHSR
jgi:Zn-dependent protease with chaperone function